MQPKSHQQREFDVLSNKYVQNNTAREIEDFENQRDELERKYWKSHDFDMLAVKYCDPAKQEAYEQQLREKARNHGKRQKEKLPKSIRYGEGNVYNIVNNEIKDGNSILELDRTKNKSVASKLGSKVEEQIRTKAIEDDDMMETRAMNRVNPTRFTEARQYGYDPITNISYKGRQGVEPAPIRQQMDKPIWNRLHSSQNAYAYASNANPNIAAQPRDLSGAPESTLNDIPKPPTGRSAKGTTPRAPPPINTTIKPDFIPNLTLPKEGMVDGKLKLPVKGGGAGSINSTRTRTHGTGRTTGRSTGR